MTRADIPQGFWLDPDRCRYVGAFGVTEISTKTLEVYGISWPPSTDQWPKAERLGQIVSALQEHKWITDQKEPWLHAL